MKKILIVGKRDDTLIALETRLSGNYSVRCVSCIPPAVFGLLSIFSPDGVVIKLAEADNSVFAHIKENYPGIKIIAAGNAGESGDFPDFRADSQVTYDTEALYGAISAAVPVSAGESTSDRPTVMVIDDDASMLRMVKLLIEKDYSVLPAPSGEKALKLLERRSADVILLDYEMPVMNGEQVLEKLRADSRFASIPVIFMTGTNNADVIDRLYSLGIAGHLVKPADAADIMAAVSKALGR